MVTKLLFHVFLLAILQAITGTSEIKGPPRMTEDVASRYLARVGDQIRLGCPIVGNPEPIMEWYKDGEAITPSAWLRFRVTQHGLKIKETATEDNGIYVCKGVNGFGSEEVTMELIVIDPSDLDYPAGHSEDNNLYPKGESNQGLIGAKPVFTQLTRVQGSLIQKPVGAALKLKCLAEGFPLPHITWYKDGEPLRSASAGEPRRSRGVLHLSKLMSYDSGVYMCKAKNILGEVNATFVIHVVARVKKPELTGQHPVNTTVDFGRTASLQCRVKSDVKPHIQWLKRINEEGNIINRNHTIEVGGATFQVLQASGVAAQTDGSYLNKLTISNALESHSGMYICLAANTMGYSYKEAYLRVMPRKLPSLPPTPVSSVEDPVPVVVFIVIPVAVMVLLATVATCFLCHRRLRKPPPLPVNPEIQRALVAQPAQTQQTTQTPSDSMQWVSLNTKQNSSHWHGHSNVHTPDIYPKVDTTHYKTYYPEYTHHKGKTYVQYSQEYPRGPHYAEPYQEQQHYEYVSRSVGTSDTGGSDMYEGVYPPCLNAPNGHFYHHNHSHIHYEC